MPLLPYIKRKLLNRATDEELQPIMAPVNSPSEKNEDVRLETLSGPIQISPL